MWNYYRDEIDGVNTSDGKSFNMTKIKGKTPTWPSQPPPNLDGNQTPWLQQPPLPALNTEVTIQLKYLCNLWIYVDLLLINCEIKLDLKWSRNWALIEDDNITGIHFTITSTNFYIPVATLSINDNAKFLDNIK